MAVAVKLAGPADRLELRVWSVGLRLLGEYTLPQAQAGWNRVPLPAAILAGASGTFYYSVLAIQGGQKVYSKPGRLVLLR